MIIEFEYLQYFDEEIWQKMFDSIGNKKAMQNIYLLDFFLKFLHRYNDNPNLPFFKKLDKNIKRMQEKHMTVNREWRYNFDAVEFRSLDELIARRDDYKIDDSAITKGEVDQSMINRALNAEKKRKKLRMAKYSQELFDELVFTMMKENRTMMEMMAELDVEDEEIQ